MGLGLPGVALGALARTSLPGELMHGGSYSWRRRRRRRWYHLWLTTLGWGQDLRPQPSARQGKIASFPF